MYKSFIKILSILLIIGLNWAGLSAVMETFAFFNDVENSVNTFSAALLDFSVTKRNISGFIGMEALSEIASASVVTKKTGSLNIQYEVNAEEISGNDDFCNALMMEVEHNGVEKHDGPLLSFSAPTTTQLGTWEFEIDLPVSATNVPHGAECNVDLVFKGWRTDVATFEESGFTDEERIELRLISRMIVLNEFLPNPNGLVPDYGFDFGEDNSTMPQGEWVELYNNSDFNYDLAGWYIWDDSGDIANKIEITTDNTAPSTTVIEGHSWLVVYMNKEVFDNDGDTVKLFDQNDKLVDSHTYIGNDYCEMEPTPGEENTTEVDGSCGGVPPNKSYARIPDGIGYWVDPVPTPGGPNKLEEEIFEEELVIEETSDDGNTEEDVTTEEVATSTEEIIPNNEIPDETGGETTEDVIEDTTSETGDSSEESEETPPAAEEQPTTLPEDSSNQEGGGDEIGSGDDSLSGDSGATETGGEITGDSGEAGDSGETISE